MLNIIKKKIWQISLGLFCLLLSLFFQIVQTPIISAFLSRIDGIVYDNITVFSMPKNPPSSNVVIINIDDYSIQREGRWPWTRDKLAMLLTNLKKAGAVVVAFDIVMSEAEINYAIGLKNKIIDLRTINTPFKQTLLPLLNEVYPVIDSDNAFAESLKNADAVLAYLFQHDKTIKKGAIPEPTPIGFPPGTDISTFDFPTFQGYSGIYSQLLQAAPHAGFVSDIPDKDGVIRHALLLAKYNNQLYISLTLSTVMRYLLTDQVIIQGEKNFQGVSVGGLFVPMDSHGQILIPFWGVGGTMDYYSASDILENKLPANALAGAIAIVGSTSLILADLHASPVAESFPGVEMNANIIAGIIGQHINSVYDWSTVKSLLIIGIIGFIATLIWPFLGPIWLAVIYVTVVVALLLISFYSYFYHHIYIAIANLWSMITLQFILNFSYSYILERRQKNKIRMLFGQYVPESYVEELTESNVDMQMQGETRDMTVFFADIRGFTTISESLESNEVKRLLNDFFTPVTDIIFQHHGTIDKYVGDMIMAFWGAPLVDLEHREHAIEATLNIKANLGKINQSLTKANLPNVAIGMGLASGPMNVGDMGSAFRRSYTVIGDTVNLSSRLQDLTRFYQVDILVSEETQMDQKSFIWCLIDKVTVKGRSTPLNIYEPLGFQKDMTQALEIELSAYTQALTAYYSKDWKDAEQKFSVLRSQQPERYLYQLYLERVTIFMNQPPQDNWDGTFVHTHK